MTTAGQSVWARGKEIIAIALEQPRQARDAYVVQACGEDAELLAEVRSVLCHDDPDTAFLRAPVSLADVPLSPPLPGRIGAWRIEREMGRGGMGVVYRAHRDDGEVDALAAIKLLPPAFATSGVIRRFRQERQVLSSLAHPNIARFLDGGTTDDGLPYLVMEYVDGQTLDRYLAEHTLTLKQRLTLFLALADAVSFAHKRLLIHRDIKPANIMVDGQGAPKLLDFGVSKALDDVDTATLTRESLGYTAAYAAPEQILGGTLTTATDVHALGIVLYELLTGAHPFLQAGAVGSHIQKAVCETVPTAPSKIAATTANAPVAARELAGDLDLIVAKALEKEPAQRYGSVEQLVEDLQRHEAGLPVRASPSPWTYRARKFLRRHRVASIAASLLLLSLMGGVTATLHQRNMAQARFNDVRQLANSFLFEFHDAIQGLPGSTPARELVVKRALQYLDQLAAESGNDPALQRELGEAYWRIGQIQGNSYFANLGDTDGAMKSYRLSLVIRQQLAKAKPDDLELQHELAASHSGLGDMFYTVGQLEDAHTAYQTALVIRERLTALAPDNLVYRRGLADALTKSGDVNGMEGFPNLGRLPRAIESYDRALLIHESLVAAQPQNAEFRLGYAQTLTFSAMLRNVQGDSQAALVRTQKAVALLEKLIGEFPANATYELNLASARNFLRFPLLDTGRTEEALELARGAIETVHRQVAQDPKNSQARRSLGVCFNNYGICLRQSGQPAQAGREHQKALAIAEELLKSNPSSQENQRDVSLTLEFLASAQIEAGDYAGALKSHERALAFFAGMPEASAEKGVAMGVFLAGAARAYAQMGKLDEAIHHIIRAVPLAESAAAANPNHAKFQYRLADVYLDAATYIGRTALKQPGGTAAREACEFLRKSVGIWDARRAIAPISAVFAPRADLAAKEMTRCRVATS
jgi:eukaryotic-like serine/threonine-protein kinase